MNKKKTKVPDMDPKQGMTEKVEAIRKAIKEAENFADVNGLTFRMPIDVYGMGGSYYGVNTDTRNEYENRSNRDSWYTDLDGGWLASSQSC